MRGIGVVSTSVGALSGNFVDASEGVLMGLISGRHRRSRRGTVLRGNDRISIRVRRRQAHGVAAATVTEQCLGESRGRIFFVELQSELKIWMFDEMGGEHRKQEDGDSNKWLLIHTVHFDQVLTEQYRQSLTFIWSIPISLHPDSGIIYLKFEGTLLSYDPNSRRLEVVYVGGENAFFPHFFPVVPCLESLNPPGCKLIHS